MRILVDSCIWIALFDPTDDPKQTVEAERIIDEIETHRIVIPFPTLYEFVDSRLSRRAAKGEFEKIIRRRNIVRLNDKRYKEQALNNFFLKANLEYNDVSLVDEILKLMIDDKQLNISYIASFDKGLLNYANSKGIKKV